MLRFQLLLGVLALLSWGLPAAADARDAKPPPTRSEVRPGDFCVPGGCRPRSAAPWSGAAFGAAVVAIGWRARRSPRTAD